MLSSAAMSLHGIFVTTASLTIRALRDRSSTPTDVRFIESLFTGTESAGLLRWSQAFVTIENIRAARMGKDNQKRPRTSPKMARFTTMTVSCDANHAEVGSMPAIHHRCLSTGVRYLIQE